MEITKLKKKPLKKEPGQSCTNEDFYVFFFVFFCFFCQASLIALKMSYQIFFTINKKQNFNIKL